MKTMKNWLSYMIAIAFLASIPLHAQAVEEQRDTVFFYNTWEQLFYHEPDLMVYDPYVYGNPLNGVEDGLYYYDYHGSASEFQERNHRFIWFGPTNLGVHLTYDIIYRKRKEVLQ